MKTIEEYKDEIMCDVIDDAKTQFDVENKIDDMLTQMESNMNEANYSFFLFSKLWDIEYDQNGDDGMEYDIAYPLVLADYKMFIDSDWNDDNRSEYECVVEFLEVLHSSGGDLEGVKYE